MGAQRGMSGGGNNAHPGFGVNPSAYRPIARDSLGGWRSGHKLVLAGRRFVDGILHEEEMKTEAAA